MAASHRAISRCKAFVFDAYGTLLDLQSAVEPMKGAIGGDKWAKFNEDWRATQLKYTWLRSLMAPAGTPVEEIGTQFVDFQRVTEDALEWALEKHGVANAEAVKGPLMAAYLQGKAYGEVSDTLKRLSEAGKATAILSNGSPDMLRTAAEAAGILRYLTHVLSVSQLSAPVYKVHPSVYQLACDRFNLKPEEICFISSNGWDAHGAAVFGFHVVWCNRASAPRERLPGVLAAEIRDLSELLPLAGL